MRAWWIALWMAMTVLPAIPCAASEAEPPSTEGTLEGPAEQVRSDPAVPEAPGVDSSDLDDGASSVPEPVETDPLADGRLTLQEAWALVQAHSPAMDAARMQVEAARLRRRAATGDLLATVTAGARYTRLSELDPVEVEVPGLGSFTLSEEIPDTYGLSLEVDQPLFAGFALQAARSLADHSLAATCEQERAARADLRVTLEEVYLGEIAGSGMLQAVQDALETLEAHRDTVLLMEEVGLATPLDRARVETRIEELQVSRVEVDSRVQLARLGLHFLTGLPLDAAFQLEEGPPVREEPPELGPLPLLLQEAYERRPDLRALEARARAASASARREASVLYPSLGARFALQYDRPNARVFPAEDEWEDTWDASLALTWRLWDFGAGIQRARAAAREARAAHRRVDQARDEVLLDLAGRALELRTATQKTVAARAALSAAEEALRVARDRHRVGDASTTELLEAQAALTQAQFTSIQARADLRLAEIRLGRSLGRDPE